jgi:hypothetical protein
MDEEAERARKKARRRKALILLLQSIRQQKRAAKLAQELHGTTIHLEHDDEANDYVLMFLLLPIAVTQQRVAVVVGG